MGTATTAAVIAANAATTAANAAANAARHQQAINACQINLATFETSGATVEQKRQYAQCVQLLYPEPDRAMPVGMEIGLKAAIILAVVGVVAPWFIFDDLIEKVLVGIMAGFCLPMVAGCFALLGYGVWWVFTS